MSDNINIDVFDFADDVLEMEKESLKNINKVEDKQMVQRIINKFEGQLKDED